MRCSWLLVAAALTLAGCSGDDRCDGPAAPSLVHHVKLHVYDASTQEVITPLPGGHTPTVLGAFTLACPGLDTVSSTIDAWIVAATNFPEPGPKGVTLTCTLTVTAPGYASWTTPIVATYDECGAETGYHKLDVPLEPVP